MLTCSLCDDRTGTELLAITMCCSDHLGCPGPGCSGHCHQRASLLTSKLWDGQTQTVTPSVTCYTAPVSVSVVGYLLFFFSRETRPTVQLCQAQRLYCQLPMSRYRYSYSTRAHGCDQNCCNLSGRHLICVATTGC